MGHDREIRVTDRDRVCGPSDRDFEFLSYVPSKRSTHGIFPRMLPLETPAVLRLRQTHSEARAIRSRPEWTRSN